MADAKGPEMRTSLTCSRYREKVRIVGVGRGAAGEEKVQEMRVGGRQGLEHVGPYKPEWTWEIILSARLVLRWGRGPNPPPQGQPGES